MQFLVEGIFLDLITELSRFRQFKIVASSSEKAVESSLEGQEINYRIEGSFRIGGERLLVNVQLYEFATDRLVWAERFEGEPDAFFTLQENLLGKVVSRLQQQLDLDILAGIGQRPTQSLKAYEYWLYGLQQVKQGTLEADEKARHFFEQAIEQDPKYSLAYSGMSLTYFNEWSCQLWDRWDLSQKGAKEWAERALQLDHENYLANLVAGKVYLFEQHFDQAESCLRKALLLNANDPFNVSQIAFGFVYLGFLKEAESLYQRALSLDPVHPDKYIPTGVLIHFEQGKYQEVLDEGARYLHSPWVDYPTLLAASSFYLDRPRQALIYWKAYLEEFKLKINNGESAQLEEKALQWVKNINPFKTGTRYIPFWEWIKEQRGISNSSEEESPSVTINSNTYFQYENGIWRLGYQGQDILLPDLKGLHDLQLLIRQAGKEIHCTELMGIAVADKGEPVFDEKAKKEYQSRLLELQTSIQEAEDQGQSGRLPDLHQEYDQLLTQLSRATGMGGKTRELSNGVEKARTAVTWRIRSAIKKVSEANPTLGKHLSTAIQTGIFCSYVPESSPSWEL